MRIVTHSCSNTEIVAALGLGEHIVGVDDHSDHPAELVSQLARIGPDQDIDVDAVAALKPDLVITSLTIPGHEQCVARLRDRGLPILVLEPTALSDIPRDIRTVADALGVPERGAALANRFLRALQPAPVVGDRPAIAVEWWPKPVIVPAGRSWVTQMIELAGGRNPWAGDERKSRPVSDEEVSAARPDAVAISWCGVPFARYRPDVVRRREAWAELPALRHDRIHCISEAWLGRPGPRLVHGFLALKQIVLDCREGIEGGQRWG